ncbi:PAS domain-containing protein [bacterium]|nr:MAG: PAS domain-containing protein [bacterium]
MNEPQLTASARETQLPPAPTSGGDNYRRQLEAVCNNATVALFIMDERQCCVYMNPAAERLTGFTFDEVKNKPLHDVIHHTRPDGSPYPLEDCPIDRAFPLNNNVQGEEVFVHKDGSFYPVAFTASPIRDDGNIVGTVIEVRATADEKRDEAERARLLQLEMEAREEMEILYALGKTLTAELDTRKLVQRVTDAATELTGAQFGAFFHELIDDAYTLYTISGVPRAAFANFPLPRATDLLGPTFHGQAVIRIADVRKDPRYGNNSPNYGMPKGHLPVVSYLAVPVVSRSGEALGGLLFGHPEVGVFTARHERLVLGLAGQTAIAIDNASLFESLSRERARAEDAYERTRSLLESITDAFFALDNQWCFTYVNPVMEAFVSLTAEELLGRNIWDVFPEAARLKFYDQYQHAIQQQVSVIFEEFYPPLNAWLEVRAYPLQGGLSVFFRDVTERKGYETERARLLTQEQKAREDAEHANRTKDEFLATLSHELRTPLNAIIGWASLIGDERLEEEDRVRGIETIKRNANLQAQLIEDILDVSRIITGKLRLEVRTTDLSTVIEGAVESVLPAAQAKGIRVQRVLDSGASLVSGDPNRLQQVVWNLLTNAIKFTPRDGRVQIRLERVGSHIEIVVADTGMGIEQDMLPHVFERFRQADSSSTRSFGGLGLGLAIVRHIVDMHGGSVEAESEGKDKGSTFIVKLPLMATRLPDSPNDADEERVHPTAGQAPTLVCPPELEGLKVLVVDDDDDARRLLSTVLESCNALVSAASNVADALAAIQQDVPDVLISDLGMPGEDGYSLIRKVRALPPEQGGHIPAAALTAYARVEDRLQVLRSGFQIHLPKPIEPAELVAVVANLAQRLNR